MEGPEFENRYNLFLSVTNNIHFTNLFDSIIKWSEKKRTVMANLTTHANTWNDITIVMHEVLSETTQD